MSFAKAWGVDRTVRAVPWRSVKDQVNSEVAGGGGPRVMVRMAWISFIILALVVLRFCSFSVAMVKLDEERSLRSTRAYSRSLVKMMLLRTLLELALNESG